VPEKTDGELEKRPKKVLANRSSRMKIMKRPTLVVGQKPYGKSQIT